jgi:hypothetical protein
MQAAFPAYSDSLEFPKVPWAPGIDVRTGQHPQLPFDPRNSPTSPIMIATAPPTSIHIALSVGEPVKNREMSELNDFDAETPKIKRRIPPARIASDTALFMKESSLISGREVPAFHTRASPTGDFGDSMVPIIYPSP